MGVANCLDDFGSALLRPGICQEMLSHWCNLGCIGSRLQDIIPQLRCDWLRSGGYVNRVGTEDRIVPNVVFAAPVQRVGHLADLMGLAGDRCKLVLENVKQSHGFVGVPEDIVAGVRRTRLESTPQDEPTTAEGPTICMRRVAVARSINGLELALQELVQCARCLQADLRKD
jgi:hypothetical protein